MSDADSVDLLTRLARRDATIACLAAGLERAIDRLIETGDEEGISYVKTVVEEHGIRELAGIVETA